MDCLLIQVSGLYYTDIFPLRLSYGYGTITPACGWGKVCTTKHDHVKQSLYSYWLIYQKRVFWQPLSLSLRLEVN